MVHIIQIVPVRWTPPQVQTIHWSKHGMSSQQGMTTQVSSAVTTQKLRRWSSTVISKTLLPLITLKKKVLTFSTGGRLTALARMARDALAMPTCSKLSSDQVRSILRGYSKKPDGAWTSTLSAREDDTEEEEFLAPLSD